MDFVVDLPSSGGYTTVFVVVDTLTKMAHFIPLKKLPTAKETATAFIGEIVRLHGLPFSIRSDRGSQFVSKFWRSLCSALQIEHQYSSAYHPQTNGQTERLNRILEQYIRCYCTHLQDDWHTFIPLAEFAYNNTISCTTDQTPFFANYGYHPSFFPSQMLPSNNPASQDYLQSLQSIHDRLKKSISQSQLRQKKYYDTRRRPAPPYKVGDLVWLSTKNLCLNTPSRKFSSLFIGPFPIQKIINPSAVRLHLPTHLRIHPTFHVSLLKPHKANNFPNRTLPPEPPVLVAGQEEFVVHSILDSRIKRRKLQYLIRWKSYGPQEDSWEDASNVHAPILVRRFHSRYPHKPKTP